MALDPVMRRQLFKSVRLWLLAVVCAGVGAYRVWATNEVEPGVVAFLAAFVVFGIPLWIYERARNRREAAKQSKSRRR